MRSRIFLNSKAEAEELAPIPRLPGEVSGVGKPPGPSTVSAEGQESTVGEVVDSGFKPPEQTTYDAFQQLVAFNWPELSSANQDFVAHVAEEIWKTTPDAGRMPVTAFADKADAQAANETRIARIAQEIGTWFDGQWNDENVKDMAFKIATLPFADLPVETFSKHAIYRSPVFWKNLEDQTMWLNDIGPGDPRMNVVIEAVGKPIDWTTADVGKGALDIKDAKLIPWADLLLPFPWKAVDWANISSYDAMGAVREVAAQLKQRIGTEPQVQTMTAPSPAQTDFVETPAQTQERLKQSQIEIERLRQAVEQLERGLVAQEPPPPKPSLLPLLGWTAVLGTVGYILYKTVNMKKPVA